MIDAQGLPARRRSAAGGAGRSGGRRRQTDLGRLARDWITLWQSELAALAVDREAQETWHTMLALWAGAAGAMLTAAPRERPRGRAYRSQGGPTGGPAGTAAAPGAAPAAAAPDPRDAEIERLARHVRELERGSPNSNTVFATATAAIAAALAGGEADAAFPGAVLEETLRQDAALIAGIAAYRRHPFRRALGDRPRSGRRAAAGCWTTAAPATCRCCSSPAW